MDDPLPAEPAAPSILYGTAWKEDRTRELTELAMRSGFRGIDTANQRRHYVEAAVGEAIGAALEAGLVRRDQLFLQTKFTYVGGQDARLPYDPAATVATQVRQSMASSLDHLGTDYVDSYLLHGPASGRGWTETDTEAWLAIQAERHAGTARRAGVSNVSLRHLQQLESLGLDLPAFVQNRCFARSGWDRAVREFCRSRGIVYQGFSLLTANPEVVGHPFVAELGRRLGATPAQVIFRFATAVAMVPLTGTSSLAHMRQDLDSQGLSMAGGDVDRLEGLVG